MRKILLSLAAVGLIAVSANAKDAKKDTSFVTHTELGYVQTSGNTDTTTFNLDANAKKAWDKHVLKLSFDAQYADSEDKETKNKYLIEANYDYMFTDRLSFNYLVGYKSDKFSGFDYQFYTGPGIKYKVIATKKQNLSVEGNILYAIDEYEDIKYDASGNVIKYPNSNNVAVASKESVDREDYAAYRVKAVYNYQITKTLKFDQELSIRGELQYAPNYFAYSKSALVAKISDIFSAGVSYKVDYVNRPAKGRDNADTTFSVNLIMDY